MHRLRDQAARPGFRLVTFAEAFIPHGTAGRINWTVPEV